MNEKSLRELLTQVSENKMTVEEATRVLKNGPFQNTDLHFANLDHHRGLRQGLGEVIYGESKSAAQILQIAEKLSTLKHPVLITRVDEEKRSALRVRFPEGRENKEACTFTLHAPIPRNAKDLNDGVPFVAVVCAGTSDLRVAEEACEVLIARQVAFDRFYDIGVSGLHRLFAKLDILSEASALIVVAGMEGALPSVVAGLLGSKPIFSVPTSVGYGASLNGVAALLAMLNSCAPGITVVNIDNGFSAGFAAANVVLQLEEKQK